jgi:uncharacterized Tic20 family protein
MEPILNFCPVCGKDLPSGTAYCLACGARVNDPAADAAERRIESKAGAEKATIAAILMFLYAIPLIAIGAWLYSVAWDVAVETLSNPDLAAMLADAGVTYTVPMLASLIETAAMFPIIAGLLGIAGGALALTRKSYAAASVLCLIGAVIGALVLFPLVLGLIAFWMLRRARSAF